MIITIDLIILINKTLDETNIHASTHTHTHAHNKPKLRNKYTNVNRHPPPDTEKNIDDRKSYQNHCINTTNENGK